MKCSECLYHYRESDEDYPSCHYGDDFPEWAPCAQEDDDYDE